MTGVADTTRGGSVSDELVEGGLPGVEATAVAAESDEDFQNEQTEDLSDKRGPTYQGARGVLADIGPCEQSGVWSRGCEVTYKEDQDPADDKDTSGQAAASAQTLSRPAAR